MSESTPPATMTPLARLLFRLAFGLAPSADRPWLEEMRFEWSFLPRRERASWAWGALVTALRFRLAASKVSWSTPRTFVLTSVMVAAMITVIVVVPNAGLPAQRPDSNRAAQVVEQEAREALAQEGQRPAAFSLDEDLSPSAAQAEPSPARGQASAEARARDADAPVTLQADVPMNEVVQSAPSTPSVADTASAGEPLADRLESDDAAELEATPAETERNTAALIPTTQASATDSLLGESAKVEASSSTLRLTPEAVVVLDGDRVTLELLRSTRLELFEIGGSATEPTTGEFAAGESLSATLPLVVIAEDAGAVSLSVDGQPLGPLGLEGLPLARKFIRP